MNLSNPVAVIPSVQTTQTSSFYFPILVLSLFFLLSVVPSVLPVLRRFRRLFTKTQYDFERQQKLTDLWKSQLRERQAPEPVPVATRRRQLPPKTPIQRIRSAFYVALIGGIAFLTSFAVVSTIYLDFMTYFAVSGVALASIFLALVYWASQFQMEYDRTWLIVHGPKTYFYFGTEEEADAIARKMGAVVDKLLVAPHLRAIRRIHSTFSLTILFIILLVATPLFGPFTLFPAVFILLYFALRVVYRLTIMTSLISTFPEMFLIQANEVLPPFVRAAITLSCESVMAYQFIQAGSLSGLVAQIGSILTRTKLADSIILKLLSALEQLIPGLSKLRDVDASPPPPKEEAPDPIFAELKSINARLDRDKARHATSVPHHVNVSAFVFIGAVIAAVLAHSLNVTLPLDKYHATPAMIKLMEGIKDFKTFQDTVLPLAHETLRSIGQFVTGAPVLLTAKDHLTHTLDQIRIPLFELQKKEIHLYTEVDRTQLNRLHETVLQIHAQPGVLDTPTSLYVNRTLTWLERQKNLVSPVDFSSPRTMPIGLLILAKAGAAGAGKTYLLDNFLIPEFCRRINVPCRKHQPQLSDPQQRHDQYRNESVIECSEFMSTNTTPEQTIQISENIKKMLDTTRVQLNMAAIEDKGRYFFNQVLSTFTSNISGFDVFFKKLVDNIGVAEAQSVLRRLPFIIRLTKTRSGRHASKPPNEEYDDMELLELMGDEMRVKWVPITYDELMSSMVSLYAKYSTPAAQVPPPIRTSLSGTSWDPAPGYSVPATSDVPTAPAFKPRPPRRTGALPSFAPFQGPKLRHSQPNERAFSEPLGRVVEDLPPMNLGEEELPPPNLPDPTAPQIIPTSVPHHMLSVQPVRPRLYSTYAWLKQKWITRFELKGDHFDKLVEQVVVQDDTMDPVAFHRIWRFDPPIATGKLPQPLMAQVFTKWSNLCIAHHIEKGPSNAEYYQYLEYEANIAYAKICSVRAMRKIAGTALAVALGGAAFLSAAFVIHHLYYSTQKAFESVPSEHHQYRNDPRPAGPQPAPKLEPKGRQPRSFKPMGAPIPSASHHVARTYVANEDPNLGGIAMKLCNNLRRLQISRPDFPGTVFGIACDEHILTVSHATSGGVTAIQVDGATTGVNYGSFTADKLQLLDFGEEEVDGITLSDGRSSSLRYDMSLIKLPDGIPKAPGLRSHVCDDFDTAHAARYRYTKVIIRDGKPAFITCGGRPNHADQVYTDADYEDKVGWCSTLILDVPSVPGDCGSPVFVNSKAHNKKLIGFVVGGGQETIVQIFPRDVVDAWLGRTRGMSRPGHFTQAEYDSGARLVERGGVLNPVPVGIEFNGHTTPSVALYTRSQLVPGPDCPWRCSKHHQPWQCKAADCPNGPVDGRHPPVPFPVHYHGEKFDPLQASMTRCKRVVPHGDFSQFKSDRLFLRALPPPIYEANKIPAPRENSLNGYRYAGTQARLTQPLEIRTSMGFPLAQERPPPIAGEFNHAKYPYLHCCVHGNKVHCPQDCMENLIAVGAFNDLLSSAEQSAQKGDPYLVIYQRFPKDETREYAAEFLSCKPIRDVLGSPAHHSALCRAYFGPLLSGIQFHWSNPRYPIKIGLNPHSVECSLWLEALMTELDTIIQGDRGKSDKTLRRVVADRTFEALKAVAKHYYPADYEQWLPGAQVVWDNIIYPQWIAGDAMFQGFSDFPTGLAITAELNSLCFIMERYLLTCVFASRLPDPIHLDEDMFFEYFLHGQYGDDFFQGATRRCPPALAEMKLSDLADLGKELLEIELTLPSKAVADQDTFKLHELEFLSREITFKHGRLHFALNEPSIKRMTQYCRDASLPGVEQLFHSALTEWYHRLDADEYEEKRMKFEGYLQERGHTPKLPSYASLHEAYLFAEIPAPTIRDYENVSVHHHSKVAEKEPSVVAEEEERSVAQADSPILEAVAVPENNVTTLLLTRPHIKIDHSHLGFWDAIKGKFCMFPQVVEKTMITRTAYLGSTTINGASTFGTNLVNKSMPYELINASPVLQKTLAGFHFFRCTSTLRLQATAPPFTTASVIVAISFGIPTAPPANVYQASHCHAVRWEIGGGQDLVLELPYMWNKPWLQVDQLTINTPINGYISIWLVSPITTGVTSGNQTITVQMYAQISDIEVDSYYPLEVLPIPGAIKRTTQGVTKAINTSIHHHMGPEMPQLEEQVSAEALIPELDPTQVIGLIAPPPPGCHPSCMCAAFEAFAIRPELVEAYCAQWLGLLDRKWHWPMECPILFRTSEGDVLANTDRPYAISDHRDQSTTTVRTTSVHHHMGPNQYTPPASCVPGCILGRSAMRGVIPNTHAVNKIKKAFSQDDPMSLPWHFPSQCIADVTDPYTAQTTMQRVVPPFQVTSVHHHMAPVRLSAPCSSPTCHRCHCVQGEYEEHSVIGCSCNLCKVRQSGNYALCQRGCVIRFSDVAKKVGLLASEEKKAFYLQNRALVQALCSLSDEPWHAPFKCIVFRPEAPQRTKHFISIPHHSTKDSKKPNQEAGRKTKNVSAPTPAPERPLGLQIVDTILGAPGAIIGGILEPIGKFTGGAEGLGSLFSSLARIAPLSALILDKPARVDAPKMTSQAIVTTAHTRGLSNAVSVDTAQARYASPFAHDGADIKQLIRIPALIKVFQVTSSSPIDTSVWSQYLNVAQLCHYTRTGASPPYTYTFDHTPLSFFSRFYQYWRGSIIFDFFASCAGTTRGLVLVWFQPSGESVISTPSQYLGDLPCLQFEINGPSHAQIEVPISTDSLAPGVPPYLTNNNFGNGVLNMSVLVPFTTGDASTATVNFEVYVRAGSNVEFYSWKGTTNTNVSNANPEPVSVRHHMLLAGHAKPTSLSHTARMMTTQNLNLVPAETHIPSLLKRHQVLSTVAAATTTRVQLCPAGAPAHNNLMQCFVGWIGGVEVGLMAFGGDNTAFVGRYNTTTDPTPSVSQLIDSGGAGAYCQEATPQTYHFPYQHGNLFAYYDDSVHGAIGDSASVVTSYATPTYITLAGADDFVLVSFRYCPQEITVSNNALPRAQAPANHTQSSSAPRPSAPVV